MYRDKNFSKRNFNVSRNSSIEYSKLLTGGVFIKKLFFVKVKYDTRCFVNLITLIQPVQLFYRTLSHTSSRNYLLPMVTTFFLSLFFSFFFYVDSIQILLFVLYREKIPKKVCTVCLNHTKN